VIAEDLIELELLRNRFNRLMNELARGEIVRNSFQPWEVEILLDIEVRDTKHLNNIIANLRSKEVVQSVERWQG